MIRNKISWAIMLIAIIPFIPILLFVICMFPIFEFDDFVEVAIKNLRYSNFKKKKMTKIK